MDDGTVNNDPARWDSMGVETARKHPLAVALWLMADSVVNTLIGLQDMVEGKLRQTHEGTDPRRVRTEVRVHAQASAGLTATPTATSSTATATPSQPTW